MFCPKCGTENPDKGKFCRSCGTDIGVVTKALAKKSYTGDDYSLADNEYDHSLSGFDKRGKPKKSPDDLFGHGIKEVFGGSAFAIIACILLFTNMMGGSVWGFWLFIPAGFMIGNGISSMWKAKRMEKRMELSANQQNFLGQSHTKAELPPSKTDYISPAKDVKYDTGDLVPPSVVENTTRQLELDSESETMTLPKMDN
jgi:hypothetical protein